MSANARVYKLPDGKIFVSVLRCTAEKYAQFDVSRFGSGLPGGENQPSTTSIEVADFSPTDSAFTEKVFDYSMRQALIRWGIAVYGRLEALVPGDPEHTLALERVGYSDPTPSKESFSLAERQALALERIADALEKLVGGEVSVDALFQQYDAYVRSKSL